MLVVGMDRKGEENAVYLYIKQAGKNKGLLNDFSCYLKLQAQSNISCHAISISCNLLTALDTGWGSATDSMGIVLLG